MSSIPLYKPPGETNLGLKALRHVAGNGRSMVHTQCTTQLPQPLTINVRLNWWVTVHGTKVPVKVVK